MTTTKEITLTEAEMKDRVRDKRRSEMAEMSFNSDTSLLMVPTDGRDLMDKANTMAGAGLMVKDIFRDNPGACAGLIMMCAPYRINPYQASWKCYQTKQDAPLAFEAQLIMAMVNTSAPISGRLKYTFDGEGANRRVTVSGVDRDSGEVLEYTSPQIKDINPKNSPLWKNDPDQQLCYSGGRAWARRHYPEILLGVYDREELSEPAPMRDVTPTGHAVQKPASQNSILSALGGDDDDDAEVVPETTAPRDVSSATPSDLFDPAPATEQPDPAPHWTASVDTSGATQGSDAWIAGGDARDDRLPATACPHDEGTQEAVDWIGGWEEAGLSE